MKISIIVPVYQVEKYLKKCVDSVLSQLQADVELILVDDGSQDSSGKICDEYSRHNQNVIALHKKNGGLSSARNFGMTRASGEYIMFLDSDDWLEQGCIVRFLDYIDRYKSDLIVAKAFLVDENGKKKSKIDYKIQEGFYTCEDYLKEIRDKRNYCACAPFTIYNANFLRKHRFRFMDGIVNEDELWTAEVLLKAESVFFADFYFYNNLIRFGSITHSKDMTKYGEDLLTVTNKMCQLVNTSDYKNTQAIRDKIIFNYLHGICLIDKPIMQNSMLNKKYLICNSYYIRTKIKAIIYIISPHFYLYLYKKAQLLKR